MESPPPQLPPTAIGILTHTYTGRNQDLCCTSVYFLPSSSLSATSIATLCDSLTASYVHDVLGDNEVEDHHQFLTPILTPFNSVQECIDHHFQALDTWLLEHPHEKRMETNPYGILVFDQQETEAVLVHFDRINQAWYLGSARLPVEDLGMEITSLKFGDLYFGDLCKNHNIRVPQNDPAINKNYAEHQKDETGSWKNNAPRFAVFSTGMSHALPVEGMLDDTHLDNPYGHNHVDLYPLTGGRYQGPWEKAKSRFPVLVAADQRCENRHERQGPCRDCRPLHKNIFIQVDNANPRADGVLVCRMIWNTETEGKSDAELEDVGRNASVETRRAGVAFAVAIARAMSANDQYVLERS